MANCFLPEEYASWDYTQNEDGSFVVPWLPQHHHGYPITTVQPFEGEATASGSRSHSEAEKRRRDRINSQLATLRKLIPKSEKLDKAALLGHVVDHVKELSTKAKEGSNFSTTPSENDEVTVDYFTDQTSQNSETIYIKATVCCEDRPKLFAELNVALKDIGFSVVQADLTSLGGRVKSVFVLSARGVDENVGSIKKSLRLVLSRVAFSSTTSNYCARSKRQKFFYPNSH